MNIYSKGDRVSFFIDSKEENFTKGKIIHMHEDQNRANIVDDRLIVWCVPTEYIIELLGGSDVQH